MAPSNTTQEAGVMKQIPIELINDNPVALRSVDRASVDFRGLVDSIRQKGFNSTITVRPCKNLEGGEAYEILDGLHRVTAAREVGLKVIPAIVLEMGKVDALEWQLMANQHHIQTRPVEYTQQLQRLMHERPLMTIVELAAKLAVGTKFIADRMSLSKLSDAIGKLVDDGKIGLSNAYALAKLPEDAQVEFSDSAMTMAPAEFAGIINARAKEIRDAKKQGRDAAPKEWVPIAVTRKVSVLTTYLANVADVVAVVKATGVKDMAKIVQETLRWVVQLDTPSVERQRAEYLARKEKAKADSDKKKAERLQKQADEAQAEKAKILEAMNKDAANKATNK